MNGEEDDVSEKRTINNREWISVCYGNDKFVTVANGSNYFAYSTGYTPMPSDLIPVN